MPPNGKVYRIRTDGTIPKGDPFYHRSKSLGRAVWASGVREPMNSSLDSQTGVYLIHDLFADLCGGWIDSLDFRTKQSSQFASDLGTQILNVDYTNDGRIFVLARSESPGDNQIKVIEPLGASGDRT